MKKGLKIALGVVLGLVLAFLVTTQIFMRYPEADDSVKTGKWYRISSPAATASDGSSIHAYFRKGSESKLMIYFQGGGVSINEETAAGEFYSKNQLEPDAFMNFVSNIGIGGTSRDNPFRNWSVLVVPYATGDFHVGQAEFPYGGGKILRHNGYTNYTAFLERAVELVGQPDELLICGFSAGGFATSLLASDVMENYFPFVDNTTVLVDSSLLLYDGWQETARTVWKAPEEISARLTGSNLVLDSLIALSKSHPEAKILFDCSVRDGELAKFQRYLDTGDFSVSAADGDVFQKNLAEMVAGIQENIPNSGIYIWDGLKYLGKDEYLTLHTIIGVPNSCEDGFGNGKTIAGWVMDAVNGEMESYGLELLGKENNNEK